MSFLGMVMTVALAQSSAQPIKLASPQWRFVGVDEKKGEFFADYLAQQIAVSGIRVTTAAEIGALLGLERQKALLGCSTDSCTAELAGALGVDAMLLCSLAQIGKSLVVNVKVMKATDGRQLAVFSQKLAGEDELLDWLTGTAKELVTQVRSELGGPPLKTPEVVAKTPQVTAVTPPSPVAAVSPSGTPGLRAQAWIPAAAGGAVLLVSGGAYLFAQGRANDIRTSTTFQSYADLEAARNPAIAARNVAYVGLPLGLAALGVAGWMAFLSPAAPVAVVPSGDGAAVVWSGVLP